MLAGECYLQMQDFDKALQVQDYHKRMGFMMQKKWVKYGEMISWHDEGSQEISGFVIWITYIGKIILVEVGDLLKFREQRDVEDTAFI